MFKKTKVNLGEIREGSEHTIRFEYDGVLNYKSINSPCDCTVTEVKDNTVTVKFKAKPAPHLVAQGIFKNPFYKDISVKMPDDTVTDLRIHGTVHYKI